MSLGASDSCLLPTAERPLRIAEFEALFTSAVRAVNRRDDRHARIHLTGADGLIDAVRDLVARENERCRFFGFTLTSTPTHDGEVVTVDVEVRANRVNMLDGLVRMAEAGREGRPAYAP